MIQTAQTHRRRRAAGARCPAQVSRIYCVLCFWALATKWPLLACVPEIKPCPCAGGRATTW